MKVIKVTDEHVIDYTVNTLREGGIVFAPTDTIYGLLVDATNRKAVERLFLLRRPSQRPFIVLLPSKEHIRIFPVRASSFHLNLLDSGVTLIFYLKYSRYVYLTRGRKSLAFRLPREGTFIRDVLKAMGLPLVAPSANPEGLEPSVDVKMGIDYFGDSVDLYVDAGKIEGEPSTVVKLIGKRGFRLVRRGNIAFEDFIQFAKSLLDPSF